jgi:uncharacterized LabA/DUF88 family protein
MPGEPDTKRVVAFIDGQNLFRSVKEAWKEYHFPNYDVVKLARAVAELRATDGWNAPSVRFYTRTPSEQIDPIRSLFWRRKTAAMRNGGVEVFTRALRYREQTFKCAECQTEQVMTCASCHRPMPDKGQEKGIDVRIALDIVRLARENVYDVALIFSQDQDLSEAVDEVRATAKQSRRWIKVACALPEGTKNKRGIEHTEWLIFDRALYDTCIDPADYRDRK